MWVFSKYGFYSIVKGDGNTWQIRARKKQDLINLMVASGLEHEIRDDVGWDYAFRVFVEAEDLTRVMAVLQEALDYKNFKNTIAAINDQQDKLDILHGLWQAMFNYQVRGEHPSWEEETCYSRKGLSVGLK